jgi:transposase
MEELLFMIYVGIDVASDKHDCCILDGSGTALRENFTFRNTRDGFNELLRTVTFFLPGKRYSDARIGLESTGHYSVNLTNFLKAEGFEVTIFNPLHVNLYRKAQTLRKTKTDKTDARFLATMLFSDNSKPYTPVSYQISELKALVRHRFRLVSLRSRLKVSVARTVTILFPELLSAVWSIHQASSYALLLEYPTAKQIASCHLTHLASLLTEHSHGKYGREKALEIRALAEKSIGLNSCSVGFELQQTIRIIQNIQREILILDKQIKAVMKEINSPILTVPGISYTLGSIILAEIGDITRFQNPAKLLAFAGLEPSTYQSGKFTAGNTPMVKRGSTYLRWAFLNAARLVSMRDDTFKTYCHKKKAEGKHHNVAMSHVGKKLVRVVFHLLKTNTSFIPQI